MNYGPLIFLASFLALSASWFGLVLTPQIQLGREQQEASVVNRTDLYPLGRPGLARQGLEVYRANNCAACHSQQVGQTGAVCDVVLLDAGKAPMDVSVFLEKLTVGRLKLSGPALAGSLPKTIREGASKDEADAIVSALKAAGAKSEIRVVPVGPDLARGWGLRRTIAADFLFDSTVMPGSQRVGPDLANVGMRLPDANWQLVHLYAPAAVVTNSPMPSYRFLFETKKIERQASPDALQPPQGFPLAAGYEIVPKPEAKALAAYLLSLRADAVLYETPMAVSAPAAPTTNAPAK